MNQGNRGTGTQQGQESRFPRTGGGGGGSRTQEASGGILGTVTEKAQEMASSVGSAVEGAWESTREGVQSAASTVASTAENAWDEVNAFMRRYPMACFGIGFGLGFLVAQCLRSDSGLRSYLPSDWRGHPQFPSSSGYPFSK